MHIRSYLTQYSNGTILYFTMLQYRSQSLPYFSLHA